MARRLERDVRIESAGIFRQPGQKRRLRVTQIGDRFAKVIIGSACQPDIQIAEIEPIQIGGQDLVLRPGLLQTESGKALDQFRAQGSRPVRGNFHELLRDRGGTGNDVAAESVRLMPARPAASQSIP